jgi:serine/threonine-protein kinase
MPKNPRRGNLPIDEEYLLANPGLDHTDVLPPATVIGGKYRLGRLVGEGGMGAVYEAEHTGLGVRVAVKLLNDIFTTDPSAVSRFRREARAAAAIRHPNIVEVTDTGTDDSGVPFIVMEYLDGESLSALLRRERMLHPGVASLIACQILAGLAAAHQRGVIHRDLKPSNILLAHHPDGSYHVKVLDFGISKFYTGGSIQDVTATGALIGTPRFMAPEQARGQSDLDGRVDIYALGVLFYRMVTGKLPFAAQTQDEVIRLILQGKPTPPRVLRPDLSPELERVILRAMALERADRYPDARAVFTDLQRAMPEGFGGGTVQLTAHTGFTGGPTPSSLSGIPTLQPSRVQTAPTGSLPDPSTRPASPHALRSRRTGRRYVLLSLVGLLLGGSVLGGYLWVGRDRNPRLGGGAFRAGPPIRLGITRYLPEGQLISEHSALVTYLSGRLHRAVELKVFEDYVDLSAQLAAGKLELAALSPYAYVRAKRDWPTLKLVATHTTSGGTSYEGYIVVKANTGIEALQDLRGRVFCYVGPTSTSGYLYPRALFRRHGMDPDKSFKATRFTGDHLAALRALESGACDGAAVFAGIFFESKRHGISPQQYTILATTARIPYDAYCVPPGLSPALADSLRGALLALHEGAEVTRKVLGEKSRITGFAAAQDSDYDSVRRIEKFLDAPKKPETPKR